MLKTIMPKLTEEEQAWLRANLVKPKRRVGNPGKISGLDEQSRVYWAVVQALDEGKWARGTMKTAFGAAADMMGCSEKTVERCVDAELERRQAMQPSISRLRDKLKRHPPK